MNYELKLPISETEKRILEEVSNFVDIPVHKTIKVLLTPFYAACLLRDKDEAASMKYEYYIQFLQDFKKDYQAAQEKE